MGSRLMGVPTEKKSFRFTHIYRKSIITILGKKKDSRHARNALNIEKIYDVLFRCNKIVLVLIHETPTRSYVKRQYCSVPEEKCGEILRVILILRDFPRPPRDFAKSINGCR